jgi:hypothetical protein
MSIINPAAVIMFSDVVGYTRMMGSDEAKALALLQSSHHIQKEVVKKYNGHVIKEIGDGLLAYFDSPGDAVRCCTEIQSNHAKLDCKIRIGLHYSSIIMEDGDIFGDGVNIASRIEPLAEPGGIYISEDLNNALQKEQGISSMLMGKAKLKNVKTPVIIYAVQGNNLPTPNRHRFQNLANPRIKLTAVPALIAFFLVLAVVIFFTVNFFRERENIQNARESLSEIEQLVQNSWRDYSQAYDLAMKASKWIPGDPKLKKLIELSSFEINVSTEPLGAEVFIKRYSEPDAPWQSIGITPLKSVRLPISIFRWKVEKKGYETVLAAAPSFDFNVFTDLRKDDLFKPNHFFRKLDQVTSIPYGMIRITGSQKSYGKLDDFFIDKFEVTNLAYKKFVDAGGYERKEFWKEKFVDDNKEISWIDVVKKFIDKNGHPGPATWENGSYPIGKENFPVSGVSWYEAKAYAVFVGKDLPTGDHWGLAQGENTFLIRWPQVGGYALFAPFSNFNNEGPVEAGSLDGITTYGAFDMAGNVQEWCDNNSPAGKLIRGGGWKSNTYMFSHAMQAPPFNRSDINGFRCVIYLNKKAIPLQAFELVNLNVKASDAKARVNVPEEVFKIYKTFYDYDPTPLNAAFISTDKSHHDWIHERVEIDAAYGDERIILHLFIPKNAKPPFQTVLYGPGSASFFQLNSERMAEYYEFPVFLDFIVRSGRVVVYPVIQGTFERRKDIISFIHKAEESLQYTEFITQVIKDYRRSIDYLVSRNDIDPEKIGFYGMSWGPLVGTLLSGVEPRIKVNVFIGGGVSETGRSEVNPWKFAPRVKVPTLMINGRFDSIFPISLCIEPFYNALGAEVGQKKLVLFDTDHIPPRDGMVAETLKWFDKYLK